MTSLSIIIVHHNRPALAIKAIRKLRECSTEFEIVLVDDCSTCDLGLLENTCSAEGVKIIRNEKNIYLSLSRKRGLSEVTGSHILFHDDDDEMYPSALDSAWLLACENPTVPHTFKIDDKVGGEIVQMKNYDIDGVTHDVRDFVSNQFAVHSTIIPRIVLDSKCFSSSIKYHEDLLMWVRLWQKTKCWSFNNLSIGFYEKSNSVMTKFSCSTALRKAQGLKEISQVCEEGGLQDFISDKFWLAIHNLLNWDCHSSLGNLSITSIIREFYRGLRIENVRFRGIMLVKFLVFKVIILIGK